MSLPAFPGSREYRFSIGRTRCACSLGSEHLLVGGRIVGTSVPLRSIRGFAVAEVSYFAAGGQRLSSIVDASAFATIDRQMQLLVAYEREAGPPTFVLGPLWPSKPECQQLLADLRERLGDKFLGLGPPELVAEQLGVADVYAKSASSVGRAMLPRMIAVVLIAVAIIAAVLLAPR